MQGRLRVVDDVEWLREFLQQLTEMHEADQPKPWQVEDAPEEYLQRMMQAVVGVEIEIVTMIGKAKLSQNQPKANQESLILGLRKIRKLASAVMASKVETELFGKDV